MKTSLKTLCLALLAMLAFSACDNVDGKWENMKWKTDVKSDKFQNIAVSADGGVFAFECKNYSPWISSAYELVGENGEVERFYPPTGSIYSLETTFARIEIKDHTVTVTFQPNPGPVRKLAVNLTAGDVFSSLVFVQSAGIMTE